MPVKYQTETSIRMTGALVTAVAAAGIALLPAHSNAPFSRAMVASFLLLAPRWRSPTAAERAPSSP